MNRKSYIFAIVIILFFGFLFSAIDDTGNEKEILSFIVDSKKQDLRLYWKDNKGKNFKSIQNLKHWVEGKDEKLVFAMNAGMYKKDGSPQGLYVENNIIYTELDTLDGKGNFYLKPNGVFYITSANEANICTTQSFKNKNVKYATQSGPMLLIDGEIHSAFQKGSSNLNIRNGVGILPEGKVVFAMSKEKINFFEFASFFKNLGCKNALYLDGLVSRTYLPEKKWVQTDGNFAGIIAVIE